MRDITIGLFGACGTTTWRNDILAEFKKLGDGFNYYNPQLPPGVRWTPSASVEEAKHLASDDVVIFSVTNETYGLRSLAEVGIIISQVIMAQKPRFAIIYVAPEVTTQLMVDDPRMAIESNKTRALLLSHLRQLKHDRVIVITSITDLIHAILDANNILESMHTLEDKWALL